MIFETTIIDDEANYIRTVLLIAFILILFCGSSFLIMRARKNEFKTTKRVLQGYALFGICFAFTRIFFLVSAYDTFINETYSSAIWTVSGYAVTMASIIFIFLVVERYILERLPIFTFIAFISLCVDLLALFFTILNIPLGTLQSKDLALIVQDIAAPILGVAICVLYIIIIKNSAGIVKSKAVKTFTGVLLILCGILLDTNLLGAFEWLNPIRAILTPVSFIIGALIVIISIK